MPCTAFLILRSGPKDRVSKVLILRSGPKDRVSKVLILRSGPKDCVSKDARAIRRPTRVSKQALSSTCACDAPRTALPPS
jgi:hypothetical protein